MAGDISINPKDAKRLAKKLKYEDPEQFQTLVRMHLSFVLDLNIDEADNNPEKTKSKLKWVLPPFLKKCRYPDKFPESMPLTKAVIYQISQLVRFLIKDENIVQEGIFRRSGKVTRQQELKTLLTQGIELSLEEGQFSVHDCASVLKSYLAELPEPLLTEAYYPAYCQIAELCQEGKVSNERMLHALQLVLLILPIENRRIMKDLLKLLNLTASNVSSNRMSAENLATLFTPHLLCPRKLSPEAFHINAQNLSCVIVYMIKEGLEVFEVPPALGTDIKAYWDRRRLTPSNMLEESVSEAKTVFSFVDRAQSGADATEKALAQLYAHVQALPDSNKKRRLVNKFNKENGHGTPKTKTLGDSIKKHILSKAQKMRSFNGHLKFHRSAASGDELNSPEQVGKENTFSIPILEASLRPGRRRSLSTRDTTNEDAEEEGIKGDEKAEVALEDEGDEEEEEGSSPPKMLRVSPPAHVSPLPSPLPYSANDQGSNGHTTESEASCCSVRLKHLSLRHNGLDDCRIFMQQQLKEQTSSGGELRRRVFGTHLQSNRFELQESTRGFRPMVVRGHGRLRSSIRRRPTFPSTWTN